MQSAKDARGLEGLASRVRPCGIVNVMHTLQSPTSQRPTSVLVPYRLVNQ
jgi:hypothetical protein